MERPSTPQNESLFDSSLSLMLTRSINLSLHDKILNHTLIPVIINPDISSRNKLPELTKHNFIVPSHLTFGQFVSELRKYLTLNPNDSLILYSHDKKYVIPITSTIYDQYMINNCHGKLYVYACKENIFG